MSYSILIVDDSLPMRSVIKRTLKAAGYISKPFTAEAIRDLMVSILGEVNYEEDFDDSDKDFDF